MYDAKQIFSDLQLILKNCVTEVAYDTFFKNLSAVCVEDNILILESAEPLAKDVINRRYHDEVIQCLQALNYPELTFKVVEKDTYVENDPAREKRKAYLEVAKAAGLNPSYTFENFVSGGSNNFAYASAVAVASAPGKQWNPLYIWGPSGLGKTHLMHAIGHEVLQHDPDKKVLYVSCETFMNEMITAISTNSAFKFREKYRQIDVLLIDDIQFISDKAGTQEEFFHTFNTLYENEKQIVIAGDRKPEEIQKLEERIKTRFKWGMVTDIKAPDYETRVAILQKKATNNNIKVDISVLSYIATNIHSNIRELEGALTRVYGYSLLYKDKEIDIDMAQDALRDYFSDENAPVITIKRIIEVVSERYNITQADITSKKKPHEIAYPRQIAMYLCRELTEEPLTTIGSYFGGRDHTTVIYAYNKIKDDINQDYTRELKKSIDDIIRRIKGE